MSDKKMVNRVAVNRITLQRNGKHVRIAAGTAFDFTPEEVEELGESLRAPVVEGRAAGVYPKVQKKLDSLVAKAVDAKSDNAKEKAKVEVRDFCEANNLEVPEGFGTEPEL